MKKYQEDLIFDLFIIENGDLNDETLSHWRKEPKTRHRLEGLTNDVIRKSARKTADKMNQEIGYNIY